MEFEVSYSLDNEQQFWEELEDILAQHADTHEEIDNILRGYLSFTGKFKGMRDVAAIISSMCRSSGAPNTAYTDGL
jgi:hypothetical protein